MKPELYNDLKKYAYSSFEYAHAGLYTLLKSDKNFANHMERKYRLKQYEQSGDQKVVLRDCEAGKYHVHQAWSKGK